MADYKESFRTECKAYTRLGAQLERAKQEVKAYAKTHSPNVTKAKKDMGRIMQQYNVGCLFDKPSERYIVRRDRTSFKPINKLKDVVVAQVAAIKAAKSDTWKKKKEAVEAIVEAIQSSRRTKSVTVSFVETKPAKKKVDECPKEVLEKYGSDMSRVTRIAVETEKRLAKLRGYLKVISTRMADLELSLRPQFEDKKYVAVPVECKLGQAPEMLKIARLTNIKPDTLPPDDTRIKRYISFLPKNPRKTSTVPKVSPPKQELTELVSSFLPDDLAQLRSFDPRKLVEQVIQASLAKQASKPKAEPEGCLKYRMSVVKKKPSKPKSGKF